MRTALHTVSYAGFWGQHTLSLEDTIRKTADLGYDGVFPMAKRPHASLLDMPPERCEAVRELCSSLGIEVIGLAAYTDFMGGLRAAEVPFFEFQLFAVRELCRMTAALGGSYLRIFTAYESEHMPFAKQFDKLIDLLREAADLAAEHGIVLGVQNHHDIAVHTDAMHWLIHEVDRPNCKATYDAWSPALRGEDLYQGALKMAPLAVNTIAADYVRLPRFRYRADLTDYARELPDESRAVMMGDGVIDYGSFLSGLKDGGYDGWATYEMCSPLRGGGGEANLDRYARHAQEILSGW